MEYSAFAPTIYEELEFLRNSFLFGICVTVLYDTIRIIRRCIPHGIFWISVEDLLFWIVVSVSFFLLQHYENSGIFRWFSIIGVMAGMGMWHLLGSRLYVKHVTTFLCFLLKQLYRICHFLLGPFFYLQDKTKIGLGYGRKKTGSLCRHLKNRLTRYIKMITITLCKRRKHPGRKKSREAKSQNS